MKAGVYSLDDVLSGFLAGHFADRAELVKAMRHEVNCNTPRMAGLLADLAREVLKESYGPVPTMKLGMMYGLVLGILMEREQRRWVA